MTQFLTPLVVSPAGVVSIFAIAVLLDADGFGSANILIVYRASADGFASLGSVADNEVTESISHRAIAAHSSFARSVGRDHERPRTAPLEIDVSPSGNLREIVGGEIRDVDDTDRRDGAACRFL